MAVFNHGGSIKGVDKIEAKLGETEALSSENTNVCLIKRYKLKASSTEKGTRYKCEECGKQMINQSILNGHIRSIHEGIKYPCGQCQHEATSKGHLARHRRNVHERINKFRLI